MDNTMNISKLFGSLKNFFSPSKEKSIITIYRKPWNLTVKGEIMKLHRTNIDKSGKHPRYILYGTIHIDTYQLDGADFEIKESLNFQGKESDFNKKNITSLAVGDVLTLYFMGTSVPKGRFIFK